MQDTHPDWSGMLFSLRPHSLSPCSTDPLNTAALVGESGSILAKKDLTHPLFLLTVILGNPSQGGLLWVWAEGPHGDPLAMCLVTPHLLGRHTFQNSSEQAGLSWKDPGSPNTSWIRRFPNSPVFFLNLYLFISLYYFWINVNEVCLWLAKMDKRFARVGSFRVGFDGRKPIKESLQCFLTLTPCWYEMRSMGR